MNTLRFTMLSLAAVLCAVLSSCSSTGSAPAAHQPSDYDLFVAKGNYPVTMDIYRDEALLSKANSKCPIYICLGHQRGRLYVDGKVAADWPVSTGISGHETPTGKFRVVEKKKEYASNRYGKFYDANGHCTNGNADVFTEAIPEGGSFVGSPMPNWHRLTWDGVGMHTGKVSAGRRLSHGCIRTPNDMVAQLFDITACGTPVTVAQEIESCYPSRQALADKHKLLDAKAAAEEKAKAEGRAALRAARS